MESSAEILRVAAAIVSAFQTAADTLETIKDRKEKKKRKKDKDVEELLELRILHKSLVEGGTRCRKHCENRHRQYSPAFEAGDEIAIAALKDVVIALQTEVIQALHIARGVESSVLDFTSLHESSVTNCRDATRAMDQLCQRIMASMQFQPQRRVNTSEAHSDSSMRSGFASMGLSDIVESYDNLPPSPPPSVGSSQQPHYQRALPPLPPLPQRTSTSRRPSDILSQRGRYNTPQASPQGWLARRTISQVNLGSEEQQSNQSSEDLGIERSQFSIQSSALESDRGSLYMQPASSTSTSYPRYPQDLSTNKQPQQLSQQWTEQPRQLSQQWAGQSQQPSQQWAEQPQQPSPQQPSQQWNEQLQQPSQQWAEQPQQPSPQQPSQQWTEQSQQPSQQRTEKSQQLSQQWNEQPQQLSQQWTASTDEKATLASGSHERNDGYTFGKLALPTSEAEASAVLSQTTRLPRIETAKEHMRALEAPEVLISSPLRLRPDLSSEKYPAFRTQSDYIDLLKALPAGMDNIWQPLTRPAMHNRYHGFCKGAWQVRKAVHEGLEVQITPSLKEPIIHWACKVCKFRSKAPNADTLPDQILFNQKYNVRYRWLFLAKSHRETENSLDVAENYKYGCIFCAAQGQTTVIHERLEHLMVHIISKHKSTMMTSEIKEKTKCIVGGVAKGRANWDIIVPESNQKGSPSVVADEFFISASKFFSRRKGKGT